MLSNLNKDTTNIKNKFLAALDHNKTSLNTSRICTLVISNLKVLKPLFGACTIPPCIPNANSCITNTNNNNLSAVINNSQPKNYLQPKQPQNQNQSRFVESDSSINNNTSTPNSTTTISLVIAVKLQGSKRILRSDEIDIKNAADQILSLSLKFSFEYTHYLRHGSNNVNRLYIMLQQKRKKNKRSFQGYKNVAFASINLTQLMDHPFVGDLLLFVDQKTLKLSSSVHGNHHVTKRLEDSNYQCKGAVILGDTVKTRNRKYPSAAAILTFQRITTENLLSAPHVYSFADLSRAALPPYENTEREIEEEETSEISGISYSTTDHLTDIDDSCGAINAENGVGINRHHFELNKILKKHQHIPRNIKKKLVWMLNKLKISEEELKLNPACLNISDESLDVDLHDSGRSSKYIDPKELEKRLINLLLRKRGTKQQHKINKDSSGQCDGTKDITVKDLFKRKTTQAHKELYNDKDLNAALLNEANLGRGYHSDTCGDNNVVTILRKPDNPIDPRFTTSSFVAVKDNLDRGEEEEGEEDEEDFFYIKDLLLFSQSSLSQDLRQHVNHHEGGRHRDQQCRGRRRLSISQTAAATTTTTTTPSTGSSPVTKRSSRTSSSTDEYKAVAGHLRQQEKDGISSTLSPTCYTSSSCYHADFREMDNFSIDSVPRKPYIKPFFASSSFKTTSNNHNNNATTNSSSNNTMTNRSSTELKKSKTNGRYNQLLPQQFRQNGYSCHSLLRESAGTSAVASAKIEENNDDNSKPIFFGATSGVSNLDRGEDSSFVKMLAQQTDTTPPPSLLLLNQERGGASNHRRKVTRIGANLKLYNKVLNERIKETFDAPHLVLQNNLGKIRRMKLPDLHKKYKLTTNNKNHVGGLFDPETAVSPILDQNEMSLSSIPMARRIKQRYNLMNNKASRFNNALKLDPEKTSSEKLAFLDYMPNKTNSNKSFIQQSMSCPFGASQTPAGTPESLREYNKKKSRMFRKPFTSRNRKRNQVNTPESDQSLVETRTDTDLSDRKKVIHQARPVSDKKKNLTDPEQDTKIRECYFPQTTIKDSHSVLSTSTANNNNNYLQNGRRSNEIESVPPTIPSFLTSTNIKKKLRTLKKNQSLPLSKSHVHVLSDATNPNLLRGRSSPTTLLFSTNRIKSPSKLKNKVNATNDTSFDNNNTLTKSNMTNEIFEELLKYDVNNPEANKFWLMFENDLPVSNVLQNKCRENNLTSLALLPSDVKPLFNYLLGKINCSLNAAIRHSFNHHQHNQSKSNTVSSSFECDNVLNTAKEISMTTTLICCGSDRWFHYFLRAFVECLRDKNQELLPHLRLAFVPLYSGKEVMRSSVSDVLKRIDQKFLDYFGDDKWPQYFNLNDEKSSLESKHFDLDIIFNRIYDYVYNLNRVINIPIGEILLNFNQNPYSNAEANQIFIPFIKEVKLNFKEVAQVSRVRSLITTKSKKASSAFKDINNSVNSTSAQQYPIMSMSMEDDLSHNYNSSSTGSFIDDNNHNDKSNRNFKDFTPPLTPITLPKSLKNSKSFAGSMKQTHSNYIHIDYWFYTSPPPSSSKKCNSNTSQLLSPDILHFSGLDKDSDQRNDKIKKVRKLRKLKSNGHDGGGGGNAKSCPQSQLNNLKCNDLSLIKSSIKNGTRFEYIAIRHQLDSDDEGESNKSILSSIGNQYKDKILRNLLTLTCETQNKKQKFKNIGKKERLDNPTDTIRQSNILRLVICSTKSLAYPLTVEVDGVKWRHVKFFQVSSQWQTHIKTFPLMICCTLDPY